MSVWSFYHLFIHYYIFSFFGRGEDWKRNKTKHTRARTKKEKNPLLCEPTQSRRGDKTPRWEVFGVLRKLNWDFRASDAVSRVLSVSVDVLHAFIYDSLPPKTLIKSLTNKRLSAAQLVLSVNKGANVFTEEAGVCRQPFAAKTHLSSIVAVAKVKEPRKQLYLAS